MQGGIKKIITEKDENGNEIQIEVTEYPDIPVIVVNSEEDEAGIISSNENIVESTEEESE